MQRKGATLDTPPVSSVKIDIAITAQETSVSGVLLRPRGAIALLVLGHGAGAGMTHQFMEALATALAENRIATLRYNFPYKEHGGRRPDPEPVLLDTVKAAVAAGRNAVPRLPVFVGGKSMGGRMASRAVAEAQLDVDGIVFFGFPLHAAGKPDLRRATHLAAIECPMLFLQGTRDRLAEIGRMRNVVTDLGLLAALHVIEDADHSFAMLKRSGRSNAEAIAELASEAASWIQSTSEK